MITLQNDLLSGYLAHREEIEQAIAAVLQSGWYILGKQVGAFEKSFSEYIGTPFCVGVASGTDAVELALRAANIGSGDLVFTVSHTAVATVAAVELAGAKPVLVDVDSETYNMAPGQLEQVILGTQNHPALKMYRPACVILVHLYGYPANVYEIKEICARYGLLLIEDCAQAHGATLDGHKVGSFGDLAAFSFYPTKNLGALGDGGMVVTKNPLYAERLKMLREYGWKQRYISEIPGKNSRLDEIQAGILSVKLKYLDDENKRRREIALRYSEAFSNLKIEIPIEREGYVHVFHQYVIRVSGRDELRAALQQKSIQTLIHYPNPIHQQPAYVSRLALVLPLTNTEKLAPEILSLPMHPWLSDQQVDLVVDAIQTWWMKNARK